MTQAQTQVSIWLSTTIASIVVDNQVETWALVVTLVQLAPGLDIGACTIAPGKYNLQIVAEWQVKTVSCLSHCASTLSIFWVYFWECVKVLWSGIQACPRKYAFTCQYHVLLGLKWNIKNTNFQGQEIVGVGQVKVEYHLPYKASRCKS